MMVRMKTNLMGYLAAIEGPVLWLTPIAVTPGEDDTAALAQVAGDVISERGWTPMTRIEIAADRIRVRVYCGSLPIAERVREALAGERSFTARVRRLGAS